MTDGENHPQDARRPGEALRAVGVSRTFDGVHALQGVTLDLHRHEIVGLIGPNGAGKSTLVNIISGFDSPSSGSVELDGQAITSLERAPARPRTASRERSSTRGRSAHCRSARTSRSRRSESVPGRASRAAGRTSCSDCSPSRATRTVPAAALAHGDERRLGVARALATEPAFVLVDEPAAGLPEAEVPEFAAVVRAVRDDHGAGVLLIDHNMALIMDVCDRIHVLDQGATLAEGAPGEIRSNLDVAAAYLGESAVREDRA